MTFDQFLETNNLPIIGDVVITPTGYRVRVLEYIFTEYESFVLVRSFDPNSAVVKWPLDSIKKCKKEGDIKQ